MSLLAHQAHSEPTWPISLSIQEALKRSSDERSCNRPRWQWSNYREQFLRSSSLGLFVELRDQLNDLPAADNWDSYDSEAPNHVALRTADRTLRLLEEAGFAAARVVASAEGGVGICFVQQDKYADIECLNSGEVLATMYTGQETPHVWDLDDSVSSLKDAIRRIREYFK